MDYLMVNYSPMAQLVNLEAENHSSAFSIAVEVLVSGQTVIGNHKYK